MANKQKRKFIDWDSVEPLYRAGLLSLNDICRQYESDHVHSQVWKPTVTHTAIIKKAKEKKWARNLADRVKARVQEKLVSSSVSGGNQDENDIIEQASEEPVLIARGQRIRTANLLKIQDELTEDLRKNKSVDIMSKVRGFKDIAAAVKSNQDQQAEQYGLKNSQAKESQDIHVTVGVDDD